MSAQTPDLVEVLVTAVRSGMADVYVSMPGRIESYDAVTQRCTAQPLIKRRRADEDGARVVELLPIVTAPVVFAGGGGFRTTYPVAVGDTCEIRWQSASIDFWLERGDTVDPEDDRRHHIADAVVHVGLRDYAHAYTSAPTDCATFGKDGGAVIEARASDIRVGGGAGHEPTFKADTYGSAFNTLITTTATAIKAISGGGAAAGAAIDTALASFNTSVAAAKTTIAKVK